MEKHRNLLGKLEAAKEKAAEKANLMEFEVTITETLQKKVTVSAISQCEAEEMVQEAWDNGDHILDADHFTGAKFDAVPVQRVLPTRSEER